MSGLVADRDALRAELSAVRAGMADAETKLQEATSGAERANELAGELTAAVQQAEHLRAELTSVEARLADTEKTVRERQEREAGAGGLETELAAAVAIAERAPSRDHRRGR